MISLLPMARVMVGECVCVCVSVGVNLLDACPSDSRLLSFERHP